MKKLALAACAAFLAIGAPAQADEPKVVAKSCSDTECVYVIRDSEGRLRVVRIPRIILM